MPRCPLVASLPSSTLSPIDNAESSSSHFSTVILARKRRGDLSDRAHVPTPCHGKQTQL
ncbi:hypothetical protein DM01DRAFT_1337648 [Hesseltinella vesiculosa]|uniref:Uncharacterized protein n=1 Tax=Hesseltinella vesiculosa TaxID=101127 RepID=A0A1X2GC65_9FUNG|nr:hypothetical protein DM01DRAFT_1337648 [Hesseltinella vesiculosa]